MCEHVHSFPIDGAAVDSAYRTGKLPWRLSAVYISALAALFEIDQWMIIECRWAFHMNASLFDYIPAADTSIYPDS
jgi:hypothetical protein